MSGQLEVPFVREAFTGRVAVRCVPSEDPLAIGKSHEDVGFPVCTATVAFDAEGYYAFCGWVQMVCSTDNSSGGREFEMDPLGPFSDNPAPFCFFGLAPTLFDAPSRDRRCELTWIAHSFLAVLDEIEGRRAVRALLGFEWGFEISAAGLIALRALTGLDASAWNNHLPMLRTIYPTWSFAADLHGLDASRETL